MPGPAAPAPPPAAHLGAVELDASLRLAARRVEIGEPGAIDRLSRVLERLDRCCNAGPAPPTLDEKDESAAGFDAGLDDLLRRVDGDRVRAAARVEPDGGAPQSPARVSICLQPSDFPRSAEKCISHYFKNARICRATRPGAPPRAGRRTAARRRPLRGLQSACNPLICLDRARNLFPIISTTKGFVGRGGAQPPIWVVEAPEAAGGRKRARG